MNTPKTSTADNQDRATQVIAEYMRRVDGGEDVDRDQFVKEHPHVAAEIERFLDNVALVEQMAGPTVAEQPQSPGAVSLLEQARRETVSATQSGDSVPEKKGRASGRLAVGKFGRYRVEKTLGEGAMGTVYLARDTELDRRVALKIPKFDDDDREMTERFYREARAAARLRHRNICAVHDIGEIDGTRYISMAYIEGRPLSDYVSPDKPPSQRNVAVIVRKLALALDAAHRDGVIHRDLKPANIMVDKKTEPVIMDFGLARQINKHEDERLTQTGTIMGSPAYMSPEQVNADIDRIGPASDIYSLGVILYELLTGHLPYEGSIAAVIGQILLKEPDKPSVFRPDLDPRLESICIKMMSKQIEDRHASMKEAAQALTEFLKNDRKAKADGPRPVGLLECFEPVELKSVVRETAAASRKSTAARRTVARRQTEIPPIETFIATDAASGGSHPPGGRERRTATNRLGNIPGWAWGIAGAFGALALVWGVTLLFQVGDQTIKIEIADAIRNDPNIKVYLDGNELKIDGVGESIELKVGMHVWVVTQGNLTVTGPEKFVVTRGGNAVLTISVTTELPPSKPVIDVPIEIADEIRDDPQLTIHVDGKQLKIDGLGDTIKLKAGRHQWLVKRGETAVGEPEQFNVTRGNGYVLQISIGLTVADSLKQHITIDFKQTPLQEAVAQVAQKAGVDIRIDSEALKLMGYTLNMPQTLSLNDKPANEVIRAILQKYDGMVIVIEKDHVLVTTEEVAVGPTMPAERPQDVIEALKKTITVDFKRTPLQDAFDAIGKQAGVEIRIDGNALKSNGYTRNMTQDLSLKDKPAGEVIQAILQKYDGMVIVIKQDHVLVTVEEVKPLTEYQQLMAGKWTPVFTKAAEVNAVRDAQLRSGGVIDIASALQPKFATVIDLSVNAADVALHAMVKKISGDYFVFKLRHGPNDNYAIHTDGVGRISATKRIRGVQLNLKTLTDSQGEDHAGSEVLSFELQKQEWNEWVFLARGNRMTAWVNGLKVIEFTDDELTGGAVALGNTNSHVQFKDVEVQVLEPADAEVEKNPVNLADIARAQHKEVESLIRSETAKGKFGRPPSVVKMKQFVASEIARRRKAGLLPQNVSFFFVFDNRGNIVGGGISVGKAGGLDGGGGGKK